MSHLTSASGEASGSSNQQSTFSYPDQNPVKKKRSLPGNPDPDAEVIALSPKTLMATNRFICEICNKGFQRDQNLQLHRRGHNLPWKLKQRSSKEVRKKVYICPEVTCVHHDPSRALGDLTGIKKHFSRKHGEKKWKCEKCSKKYAVQSDWKAHSKICGTREYKCDCGTIFSRRDSFITHRAFCDALAEENARAISANPLDNNPPLLFSQPTSAHDPSSLSHTALQTQFPHSLLMRATEMNANNIGSNGGLQELSLKREQQHFNMKPDIPSWLACQGPTSLSQLQQEYINANSSPLPPSFPTPRQASIPSPHMSATALLQKAAQMGATHNTTEFGLGFSPHQEMGSSGGFGHGSPSLLHQDMMMNSLPSASGFDGSSLDAFRGMMRSKREGNSSMESNIGGKNDEPTRDFLGLRAFSHRDILNMAGLDPSMSSSSYEQPQQNKKPWHG
ncbi:protein indeterminate-domain 11-like [Typha latifolia]|uniref:protein indeterminate-domain 11-like n=1 Tax=Typha latifolia TaxID=4733 RepID=UPI003C2B4230